MYQKIFLLLFLCSVFTDAKPLEHIKLQLQWKHQFEFAGYYAAKEKGFYEEAGLDVELLEIGRDDIIQEVLERKVEYGLGYSSIIASYMNGKDIVMLTNFFKQSPFIIIAQEEFKTPADLLGKKIMGTEDPIFNMVLNSVLSKFNIREHDYKLVPMTYNLKDFTSKKVDAVTAFVTNEVYVLDKQGYKYNIFNPNAYGISFYDQNLFTSREELQEHPKRVKNFRDASIKGWEYALTHKEEIVKLIKKKYNTLNKSTEALMYEANKIESIMLPKIYPIGSIDKQRVKNIVDNFTQSGIIGPNNRVVENLIYKELLKNTILTQEEKILLSKHNTVKVCVNKNFLPFEKIDISGNYTGMISEYGRLFEKRLGIHFSPVGTINHTQSLNYLKHKKCDLIMANNYHEKKYTPFLETKNYLTLDTAYVTHNDTQWVLDFSYLTENNHTIGILNNSPLQDILKKKYKDINLRTFTSVKNGLNAVSSKHIIAFVSSIPSLAYEIQQSTLLHVKIAGYLDEKMTTKILTNDTMAHLIPILNKGILTITEKDKTSILKNWVPVNVFNNKSYKFLQKSLIIFIFLFIIGSLLLMYFKYTNKKLKTLKKELADINNTLVQRVNTEVEKNRKHQLLMLQQSRLAQMGEIISMIAHQWKQPLSTLSLMIQTLEKNYFMGRVDDAYMKKQTIKAMQLITYMSDTVSDFRDFFKPEKEKSFFTINEVIVHSLELIQPILERHSIHVTYQHTNDITSFGYKNELGQSIINILNNAKDAFLLHENEDIKKEIILSVSIKKEKIHLTIQDNAGGIPNNIIDKIFGPYFSTKEKKEGTGIGLYMSKLIIEDHCGGKITAENNKDGALFTIVLPEFQTEAEHIANR